MAGGSHIDHLHLKIILAVTCRGRPGCFNSSKGRQNQTQAEVNRILHYTKLLIKDICSHTVSMDHPPRSLKMDEGSLIIEKVK